MRLIRTPNLILSLVCFAALAGPGAALAAGANAEQGAFGPALEIADAPTAQTLYARMFNLNTRLFRGGGIVMKAVASFNNSLQIGVGFKANNVVGSGNITFDDGSEQVVAALVKLRILSFPALGLQAAIGYDGMGYDVTRKHGLHGVVSKDINAGFLIFRLHGGAGTVQFRDAKADRDVNAFCGLSGSLSEDIHLGLEWDDALYRGNVVNSQASRLDVHNGSVNAMIGYSWDVGLRMELDFKNLLRGKGAYHRVLKILYTF
ncbi:MAG: hypothetical protein AAB152_16610 [Candidatus Coatesbacteria bacterium]